MKLNITSGVKPRAQKILIYGVEGIGKTTLAANAPGALVIDTEGGTAQMPIRRIDDIKTWPELLETVEQISKDPSICKTLVLDTADWAEAMCIKYICEKFKKSGLEDFGYGRGYTYVSEEFQKLVKLLNDVINAGIHVILTAHAHLKKFEQPDEMGAYDRWELKLSKQVAPIVKEWADCVLFLNYKTYVITTESNSKKAQGGKRVMYATHSPVFDAKNRHGLPDEMELDYKFIENIFIEVPREPAKPAKEEKLSPQEELSLLIKNAKVSTKDVIEAISSRGQFTTAKELKDYPDEFIQKWIIPNWDKLVNLIEEVNAMPF